MKIPYELQIGWRYTRAGRHGGRKNRFISFISAISTAGIALGVMALIVVLSVMNGFQKEVRDRMLSVLSHIEVFAADGDLVDWQKTATEARQHPAVLGAAPYVGAQAMVMRDETVRGVIVRGIDPELEPQVSEIQQQVVAGSPRELAPDAFNIVLGGALAQTLGVTVGSKVTLVAPQGSTTPAGWVPRLKTFTVVGLFESGHYEYDSSLVLIHLADAQKLFRLSGVTGVRLKTNDMQAAPLITHELARRLSGDLLLRDWSSQNRNWFAAVKTEKRMMFIILTLIIAVAAFNLVSMLVMTVTDKRADIAILRTLGATPRSIQAIFIVQGALIGWLGTLVGVLSGCLIAANVGAIVSGIEWLFGVQFLPREIYFISSMPSELRLHDVLTIAVISFLLSLLATLYPSWRAARIEPAEALRYE
ncbi:lipoprotein-releasing ABC transporter permease subunit [Parvibium lacunae]|uniref:Lipoprotein-releasing ABC transporter permease subunit n=1 Tax=Parvibium lacunae TaxID=1888893 RepID=A0A368L7W8_9BURK|nr:lipoprotein-releasing ABC transporter permease subunit [Parvibium lacunae]RCS59652.1 lipoprotein-releasing ABC transporter permease subunit [Parvibium lacunae]